MPDLLVPRAALPYLEVSVPAGQHHPELGPLRREALDVLATGYRSLCRLGLGLLAWVGVLTGSLLLVTLPVLATPTAAVGTAAGVLLLAGGLWLGTVVHLAGRRVTRAAADWLRVPAVGASGRDAGPLYGVVRGRAVLAGAAGAVTVALAVLLVAVVVAGGTDAGAFLGPVATLPQTAVDVVGLAVAALGTGSVAVSAFGGVRRVLDAAWSRPTVAPAGATLRRAEPPTAASTEGALYARGRTIPSSVEVVLADGRALRPGATLVGRGPVPRPEDVVDDALVLTDQTVTKTHATITVEPDVVRVVDRASTNGTVLEAPDGSLVRCRPWQVTIVWAPAIIHLGHTRLLVRTLPAHRSLEVA